MSDGKAIAQAGHAYLQAFLDAQAQCPDIARDYASETPNTKIALDGGDIVALERLHDLARARGIPCSLVIDSGHVELPDFDGTPTVSALGIGPLSRKDARILRRLKLWGHPGSADRSGGGAP